LVSKRQTGAAIAAQVLGGGPNTAAALLPPPLVVSTTASPDGPSASSGVDAVVDAMLRRYYLRW
jgi:hypothetical protein